MNVDSGNTAAARPAVLIVGAGLAGLSLGAALAGAGVPVAIVDRVPRERLLDPTADGRTTAIAYGARRVFEGIGVWRRVAVEAEPIVAIRVSDRDSPLFLDYDHREVGTEPLGHIVENRHLRRALVETLEALPGADFRLGVGVDSIDRDTTGVIGRLDDGSTIEASLAVAADGRASRTRAAAGIRTVGTRYPQTAIVLTAVHERPHRGIAHERFLPAGPFAILPMTDDAQGRHRSSIVWTEASDVATRVLAYERPAFDRALALRFGDFLGAVHTEGRVWSHPLSVQISRRLTDLRLAIVGDAAHGIHPIAGQGFNLGLRDVGVLAEEVVEAWRLGLDVGAADVLQRYARRRRPDGLSMVAVTDGLNRLFSNDIGPLRLVRDLGLAGVGRVPPLKRLLIRHAMGSVGDLPRLARGRPL